MELCNDVQTAWDFFNKGFSSLVRKHAPFRRCKVKGRENPWFTPELSDLWEIEILLGLPLTPIQKDRVRGWLAYFLQKAKSDFYLWATKTENLNDPQNFGKSIRANENHSDLPLSIIYNDTTVSDRASMLDCFNKRFIASGSLFSRSSPPIDSPAPSLVPYAPDADLTCWSAFLFYIVFSGRSS